jgi:predicted kinase
MRKIQLRKPLLIYLYGMPGSGKSYLARNLSENYGLAVVSSNKIRSLLFENPLYDKSENQIIEKIMLDQAEQFLKNGIGVVYDISASRVMQRRSLRELTRKLKIKDLLIWLQIDQETAYSRSTNRDHRKPDDKYNKNLSLDAFNIQLRQMQNPLDEAGIVVSGKHIYSTQNIAIQKKLLKMGLIESEDLGKKIAKPELVNLVSKAQVVGGRVNYSRRNIIIR